MTILSQKTMPWGNHKLASSNFYIWAKGCTISCIAMILDTTPDVVNDRLNSLPADENGNTGFAKDSTGQLDLVYWKKIEEAFSNVKVNRVWSYNNDDVLAQLAAGKAVMVEVPADPIGNPGGKHWVVYIGNHQLVDPWEGKQRPTSDFPNPSGYCVIERTLSAQPAEVSPVPVQQPTPDSGAVGTYQGLDLTNRESIKVAIDTWKDVANGLYVKADEYIAGLNKIADALGIAHESSVDVIVEHIKTLKENFKNQVLVATGLPAAEQIEGQGTPVIAVPGDSTPVVTMVNLPVHEKTALLTQIKNAAAEIEKLLGL